MEPAPAPYGLWVVAGVSLGAGVGSGVAAAVVWSGSRERADAANDKRTPQRDVPGLVQEANLMTGVSAGLGVLAVVCLGVGATTGLLALP